MNGLDYAVVRLAGTPGNQYGTAELAETDAQDGDSLCIIQHSGGSQKRIKAGHATHIHPTSGPNPDYFDYVFNTLGGLLVVVTGPWVLRSAPREIASRLETIPAAGDILDGDPLDFQRE